MMAERQQLMKRLDRMYPRTYTVEDLTDIEYEIYGTIQDCQRDKKEHEKNSDKAIKKSKINVL